MSTNVLGSNYGTKVVKAIAAGFESNRVTTKTVDTQNIKGEHDSSTGDTIYHKRKTSYRATESSDGDLSGSGTNNDILVGRIPYTRQNVISVFVDWGAVEEALELNELEELLMPIGEEVCDRAERNLNDFMIKNSGLTVGDPDTPVAAWSDVAKAQAFMDEIGVPNAGKRYYQMNSFTQVNLAGIQTGLNNGQIAKTAWENAQVSSPLAGLTVLKSNALKTYTSGTSTDRVGALAANPTVTWAAAKDTMTQQLSLTGFTASTTIAAGDTLEVTGRYHVNPRNSNILIDESGTMVKFRWTVVTGVTLDSSGEGVVTVTNAAIFDAASNNQYDNVSSAPVSTDVVTLLGTAATVYKPNLFYHKNAVSFATISLPKLYVTDATYQTKDGLTFRMSRFSDGAANKQKLRVDLMPAFGIANPLHCGRSYGVPS